MTILRETAEFIFSNRSTVIGLLRVDASISEAHNMAARVTRHAIEEGSDITDHVHVKPVSLTIEGVVSSTPVVGLAGALLNFTAQDDYYSDLLPVRDFPNADGNTERAYDYLYNVLTKGLSVDIYTTLREYPGMLLEDVTVKRDAAKGNALHFTCRAVEVRKVSTESVDAPLEKKRKKKKKKGKKDGSKVGPPNYESVIHKVQEATLSSIGW